MGNATVGVNTVMWNIDWKKGDVIVGCMSASRAVKIRADILNCRQHHIWRRQADSVSNPGAMSDTC